MDNKETNPGAGPTSISLAGAPGSDLSFDSLFPTEDGLTQPTQAAYVETPQAVEPQAVEPPKPFIQTSTGTIYKTLEDAVRGTEVKDSTIAELRQKLSQLTGEDPITHKPAQRAPVATTPQDTNYAADPSAYYKACQEAAASNDPVKWAQAQSKFLFDQLAPYGAILNQSGRQQAVDKVSQEVKEFRTFQQTPEYRDTIDALPELKQAIERCENDPRGFEQLPGLYKIAAYASWGRTNASRQQAQPVTSPTVVPATRPSITPSTMTPTTTVGAALDLSTTEGRKAIIENAVRRGVDRMPWPSQ